MNIPTKCIGGPLDGREIVADIDTSTSEPVRVPFVLTFADAHGWTDEIAATAIYERRNGSLVYSGRTDWPSPERKQPRRYRLHSDEQTGADAPSSHAAPISDSPRHGITTTREPLSQKPERLDSLGYTSARTARG